MYVILYYEIFKRQAYNVEGGEDSLRNFFEWKK